MTAGVFIPVYRDGEIIDHAWIDEADAALVSSYKWGVCWPHAIATGRIAPAAPKPDSAPMHRVILGLRRGEGVVHHVNEDGLDNRRHNLKMTADRFAHGYEPHPRRDLMCGGHYDLPPHERVVRLAEAGL